MNVTFVLLQFAAGVLIGASLPLGLIWLVFVYRYSEVSLKAFWIGGGVGLLVTAGLLVWWVVMMSRTWGAD